MANIRLLGADYPDVPAVVLPTTEGGTATFTEGGGTVTLKPYLLRPDAEKIQTYTYDKLLVTDEEINIPAYTTTATTVKAAAAFSPTISLTYADYNYYVLERFLTIPIYNTTTTGVGREEYHFSAYLYEIADVVGSSFRALVDGKLYTTRTVATAGQAFIRQLYWSSASALSMYTATSYGVAQVVSAPSVSSSKLTVNAPSLQMRGHKTYFTSTYWGALTDIRLQYVIEVWRSPKNNLNIDGWGLSQQGAHIASCIDGVNNKLT